MGLGLELDRGEDRLHLGDVLGCGRWAMKRHHDEAGAVDIDRVDPRHRFMARDEVLVSASVEPDLEPDRRIALLDVDFGRDGDLDDLPGSPADRDVHRRRYIRAGQFAQRDREVVGGRPDVVRIVRTARIGEEPIDDRYTPADFAARSFACFEMVCPPFSATQPAGIVNEKVAGVHGPSAMKYRPGSIGPLAGIRRSLATALGVGRGDVGARLPQPATTTSTIAAGKILLTCMTWSFRAAVTWRDQVTVEPADAGRGSMATIWPSR